MAEQKQEREQQGRQPQNKEWRGGSEGSFNQQGIPGNAEQAGEEGGDSRDQGSYGYQGGYDEQGEEEDAAEQNKQRAAQPGAGNRSGYETGYQGGRGGEYPNYGDEGSFGGASDRQSAYGPTSGDRPAGQANQDERGQR